MEPVKVPESDEEVSSGKPVDGATRGAGAKIVRIILAEIRLICLLGILLTTTFTAVSYLGPVVAMLGPGALVCELTSHFHWQYAIAALLALLFFVLLKDRRFVFLCVVVLILNAVPVLYLYLPAGASMPPGSAGEPSLARSGSRPGPAVVRLISANVNNKNQEFEKVISVLNCREADIICIDELAPAMAQYLKDNLKSHPYNALAPRADCFGIGVYSRLPLQSAEILYLSGSKVPSVRADLDLNGIKFRLIATHPTPPTTQNWFAWRNEQFVSLAQLSRKSDKPVVIAGDLNSTCWSPYFTDLLARGKLQDSEQGFGLQPSWPTVPVMDVLKIAIDHVVVSPAIKTIKRAILPDLGSDHYPLYVELQLPEH